jgi:hypothetical protein
MVGTNGVFSEKVLMRNLVRYNLCLNCVNFWRVARGWELLSTINDVDWIII